MENYRNNTPATLGSSKVVMLKDYKTSISKDMITGAVEKIDLPSSNVLQFFTEDGSIISARPSGTEPKIKFYCSVNAPLLSKEAFEATEQQLTNKINAMLGDLGIV